MVGALPNLFALIARKLRRSQCSQWGVIPAKTRRKEDSLEVQLSSRERKPIGSCQDLAGPFFLDRNDLEVRCEGVLKPPVGITGCARILSRRTVHAAHPELSPLGPAVMLGPF